MLGELRAEVSRATTLRKRAFQPGDQRHGGRDARPAWFGEHVSMLWVLIHMIEETARYAGHLDVLRELIDGGTGDHRPD